MSKALKASHVFVNCPFDAGYKPIFDAIVFAICSLGFVARCSLEEDDGSDFRVAKIHRIIEECRLGINDISSVALDATTGLPRFNMPFELGLFLGCKRFGLGSQEKKRCLILDIDLYRYRTFLSDIAGQDIKSHGGDPESAIREVRDWLRVVSRRKTLPGGGEVIDKFRRFNADLPHICRTLALEPGRLTFLDLSEAISEWLRINR